MTLTGNEVPGVEAWLSSVLCGDATVQNLCGGPLPACRVFPGHVPEGVTTFPCVVFASAGGYPDSSVTAGQRILANLRYQVKAIDKSGSNAGIAALANQIDALIHRQSGTGTYLGHNTQVLACVREMGLDIPETDAQSGVEYRHLGGFYKILAQNT